MKIFLSGYHSGIFLFALFSILVLFEGTLVAQNNHPANTDCQFSFQDETPLYLVNIGNADLGVRYKKGEGVPVVFVHGSWDDHNSWLPVAEQLARRIANPVLLYDRRGHSTSTPDNQQGTISLDVDDALLLIEKLGFEKAHFIGHSYGANIVVQLALTHPQKAVSIVLYEPPIFGLLKGKPEYIAIMEGVKTAMASAKSFLENGEVEKGTIHFIEKVAFGEDSWKTVFDGRARNTMTASYRTWLDQSNDPERLDIHPENLDKFKGNITLISGTSSIVVYPAVVNELKEKVGKIEVKTISGAGHGGLVSHPEETAMIIVEHLKKLEYELSDYN